MGKKDALQKKVVLVRRPESRIESAPIVTEQPLQLPKIAPSSAGEKKKKKKKTTVIIVKRMGESLQPLTPHSEKVEPQKPKGPIIESDGSLVEWSVLGNPEDYHEMMSRVEEAKKEKVKKIEVESEEEEEEEESEDKVEEGTSSMTTSMTIPMSPVSQATSYFPCSADTHYSLAVNVDASEYRPRYGKTGPGLELSDEHLALTGGVGELLSGRITAHNTGTATVYFSWRHVEPPKLPGNQQSDEETKKTAKFYFNDLQGSVLPGEHRLFTFVFRTLTSGIFFDEWELKSVPNTGENHHRHIRIKAISIPKELGTKVKEATDQANRVETELHERSTKKAMKQVVVGIIEKSLEKCSEKTHSKHSHGVDDEVVATFIESNPTIYHTPEAVFKFRELASDAGFTEKMKWDMTIPTLETAIEQRKDPGMTRRLEELMLHGAVPEFERSRKLLFVVGRMLLTEAIDDLPGIWQTVCGTQKPTTKEKDDDGDGKSESEEEEEEEVAPKRTFAAYLERLRKKKAEEISSTTVSTSVDDVVVFPITKTVATEVHQQQPQSEQQQQQQQQQDRHRRRGWARVTSQQTTNSSSLPETPPLVQVKIIEQPQQEMKQQQQPKQQPSKAGRRRRTRESGREGEEGREEGRGVQQKEQQQEEERKTKIETAEKKEEEEKKKKERLEKEKRKSEVTGMFRMRIMQMVEEFEIKSPPKSVPMNRPSTAAQSKPQTRPVTATVNTTKTNGDGRLGSAIQKQQQQQQITTQLQGKKRRPKQQQK